VPAGLAGHPRYEVEEVLLGAGGMGTVFKARHRLMDRTVALKVMSPELMHRPAAVERFQREVRVAAQLAHPNIVTSFDAEQAGDCHFLAMEFIEGTSLAHLVADEGPMPIRKACDYIRQSALGLHHAHEQGMVHRDIKLHNLMLTLHGQVKILDFGLARFLSESAPAADALARDTAVIASSGGATLDGTELGSSVGRIFTPPDAGRIEYPSHESHTGPASALEAATASPTSAEMGAEPLTRLGAVMGSPDYIAPEQIADAHAADIRADIYSLGCTLYFLLAGQAPYQGSVLQKLRAHEVQRPRPLRELRPEIPAHLAAVLDRVLAKDPAHRYQTPAEVAEALAPFAVPPIRRYWRWIAAAAAVFLLAGGLVLSRIELGAAVVRIATNKGELVIETEDPDVQVEVLKGGERVRIVDLKTGKKTDLQAGDYEVKLVDDKDGLVLSSDHFTLSRGGKQIVWVTREQPEKEAIGPVRVFQGHDAPVYAVARSPNGRLALSSGADKTIRLWDLRTGKELRQFVGHKDGAAGVHFLDNRRAMSIGLDKTARLWDVASGHELARFELPAKAGALVAASLDGRRILSCGEDFTMVVWDFETSKEIHRLTGHT
jgi:serine/threonine protein kinase